MNYEKIVLAAGSGYLGQVLIDFFKPQSKEIVVLSRGTPRQIDNVRFVRWDAVTTGPWVRELEAADLLVNLTGRSVNCRYNAKNKSEILNSRLDSVKVLGQAIQSCTVAPKVWVQCASATIYMDARVHAMDERSTEMGDGFSEQVCKQWEGAFFGVSTNQTIKKLLRITLVVGKSDGVYPRLKSLAKLGLGGYQGSGNQMMSWVHELDFSRIVQWSTSPLSFSPIYNCAAPYPVTNREFMKQVRVANKVPFGLPCPTWMMKIGAFLIGTEAELVLKSRWVIPTMLLEEGFEFSHPTVLSALNAIEG